MEIYETAKMVLSEAKKCGATGARVAASETHSYSVELEQGNVRPQVNHGRNMILVVYVGERTAMVQSLTTTEAGLKRIALKAVEMARASMEDPFARLSEEILWPKDMERLRRQIDKVDLSPMPSLVELTQYTRALEDAVMSQKGITKTESVSAGVRHGRSVLMTSKGFVGFGENTGYGLSIDAVAGDGDHMVQGSDGDLKTHRSDLRSPMAVGLLAAERALMRLGSSSFAGGRMPVVFDRRSSNSIIGSLIAATFGSNVFSDNSFLKEYLGKRICSEMITIADNPFIPRMGNSRMYDGEAVASRYTPVVMGGILQMWLTSLESSGQLNVPETGHSGNRLANVVVSNGVLTREELISDISQGLLVTATLGHGANITTGDYSCGAEGFLIQNGKVARPVDEMTIAGNLLEMFSTMCPANDRDASLSFSAPSMRIENMMVAGKN